MEGKKRLVSVSNFLRHREGWQSLVLDWIIAATIALVSLWLHSPPYRIHFNVYDLGIAAYGGFRVLDGFIPYTEMHIIYGSAQYYMRALLFDLLGTSIETMKLEQLIAAIFAAVAIYWALRGCTGRAVAVVLSFIIPTLFLGALPVVFPALVGMFVAVGCMTRYSRRPSSGWLVALGSSIGVVGAFRWDFGFYCIVVFVIALASLPSIRRLATPPGEVSDSVQVHVRHFLLLLASAVLATLPFYAPTLLTDPLAIYRSIGLALDTHGYRSLPWPDVPSLVDLAYGEVTVSQYLDLLSNSFPAYSFFFICPLNVIAALLSLRRGSQVRPSMPLLVHTQVTTLLGASLIVYASARADLGHTLPATAFTLFSLPLVLWFGSRSIGRPISEIGEASLRALILRWGVLVLVLLILTPTFLMGIRRVESRSAPPPQEALYTAPTLAGLYPPPRNGPPVPREYNALVDYIKENTAPDEFIFSGNFRHDKLFVNDVLIYFASERHAGTRDYQMDPGSTTRRDVQQQIISDLERNDVRMVVLRNAPPPTEPNKSAESSGVTDLDDYIKDNYVVQEQFGQYSVLTNGKSTDSYCASSDGSVGYGFVDVIKPLTGGSEVEPNGQIDIGGWAATPAGSSPIERVEVNVEGQTVEPVSECMPREDLAQYLGEDARYSKWQVTVDLRNIEKVSGPTVDVYAEAIDRNGGRHPLPKASQAKSELLLAP